MGERIRASRQRLHPPLSQEKLGFEVGLSRTSIVNIEAGRQHPPVHVLWTIAEVLRTDLALLLPSTSDYQARVDPVTLDPETVLQIEAAADGDPTTKRDLSAFISRAKRQPAKGADEVYTDEPT